MRLSIINVLDAVLAKIGTRDSFRDSFTYSISKQVVKGGGGRIRVGNA